MSRIYINDGWGYTKQYDEQMKELSYDGTDMDTVRIPHTVSEIPIHYFDEQEYQLLSGYRRVIHANNEWLGKHVILTFEGVAHSAVVYVNGNEVIEHHSGYTAFSVDIANYLNYGADNIITVAVDSRENQNIPPFGYVIDYLTFGGIYRDVYLDIRNEIYISDVFSRAVNITDINNGRAAAMLKSSIEIEGVADKAGLTIRQILKSGSTEIDKCELSLSDKQVECTLKSDDIELWSPEHPFRYEVVTELLDGDIVVDSYSHMTAFRDARFEADGFYLNGIKYKIRGLNRHQSYPYVGYAMPESMQRYDAFLLKNELGCNAVRTSHYPQSHFFIDECDRLGLLVFMEFPGWQHIGDDNWKEQACINLTEMIKQYRNHPSIILWGVRINESQDDDEFYIRTNRLAHELDDSRPTGGVRAHKKSHLFEDVYTYNDFVHSGDNVGCEPKKKVTSDMNKPYMVTEYNGHMYPTKAYDWEEHRMEHMLRHARVLNAVAANDDIAGSFGWCMFDYNTHKDFGSGDRICYHGVMDMFRNPKLAATVYAMQQDDIPVLELSSSMDIGEHPASNRGSIYILTNADSVRMYKNDVFIKEYRRRDTQFAYLKNGPIVVDDFVGDEIEKNENFKKKQARYIKEGLNHVAVNGYKLPPRIILKALYCMLAYKMKAKDALELYNKYIGDWGGTATKYRFEAVKNGRVVKTITKCPMTTRQLMTVVSAEELVEKNSYDVSLVRVSMRDENGNLLHFYNDPVSLKAEGPIEIIGPSVISLSGGMAGVYVRTVGESGTGRLTITTTTGETVVNEWKVTCGDEANL